MASTYTPAITSAGIGSGLDVTGMVNSLISAESVPLTRLNQQKTDSQSKITAFGTIKSNLSQFQTVLKKLSDPKNIQTIAATSSDATIITATGTNNATPGSYNLQVNQLAQSQKLATAGQTSQTSSIGTGVISFDFGTIAGGTATNGKYTGSTFTSNGLGVKTVTIDQSHNSLTGIRDSINAANIGVTATIVNDGSNSPYRLTLTNSQTGETQSMKISVTDNQGGLSSLLNQDPAGTQNLTETVNAQNAKFTVDGISITKTSNTVKDAIPGVTLNLLKASASTNTQVTVSRDTKTLSTNLNDLVTKYNSMVTSLKSMTSYDTTTKKGAVLYGDSTVRSILSQVRSVITSSLSNEGISLTRLDQVGIELQANGTLSLNQTKLNDAINTKFDQLTNLFSTSGVATDSYVQFLESTSKTKTGNYAINVSQMATQGSISGTSTLSSQTPLTIDSNNKTLTVNLNGTTSNIDLPVGSYSSASSLALIIQSRINGVKSFIDAGSSVSYSVNGNSLSFNSSLYGSGSKIEITSGNAGNTTVINALFGTPNPTPTSGSNVIGTINQKAAIGSGQTLTGATGDATEGLKIQINSGTTGSRGTIAYTQGFAYQLDQLATGLLDTNGIIASRNDGITSSMKKLDDKITRLQDRLDTLRQQYTKQFNTLDKTMSQMKSTSSYLSQQLSTLSSSG